MNRFVDKHRPASERPLSLSSHALPIPCAILLRSFTDGGPVPDDFTGLPKTSAALKAHVRPDGAIYKGAYQSQGVPESVVLVYGPKNLTDARAEEIASIERHALVTRHATAALGSFARHPHRSSTSRPPRAG